MRWTTRDIRQMKGRDRIPVLTCYDHTMTRLLDQAGIPILLVGDSLGNVVLGYDNTVPVTVEEMIGMFEKVQAEFEVVLNKMGSAFR